MSVYRVQWAKVVRSRPFRRRLIFSTELVFGPVRTVGLAFSSNTKSSVNQAKLPTLRRTNSANDGCAAVVFGWAEFGVQARKPLVPRTAGQMVERVRHDELVIFTNRAKIN